MRTYISRFVVLFISMSLLANTALAAFTDVPATQTHSKAIEFLEQAGVSSGKDRFYPDRPVTFAEFLAMGFAASGITLDNLTGTEPAQRFTDVSEAAWFAPFIARAEKVGILDDYRNELSPRHPITRAEAAKLGLRIFGYAPPASILNEDFGLTDVTPLHRFATYIFTALKIGALDTTADNEFSPGTQMTRAETAELFYRLATDTKNSPSVVIQAGSMSNIPNENLLETVWQEVKQKFLYDDKIDEQKMLHQAVKGAVEALGDEYSVFFPPEASSSFNDTLSGSLEGIGAYLSKDEKTGDIVIVAPIRDTPAERVGLKSGDIILEINDESIKTMSVQEVTAKIKGPAGTTVKLTIKRGADLLPFTVTRAKIEVKSVKVTYKNGLALVTVAQFGGTTSAEFADAVSEIKKQSGLRGIVIDLRNNPGGLLTTAIDMIGYFLPKDSVAAKARYRAGQPDTIYKTQRSIPDLKGMKTVVLVNKGSASASEIFAAALQDTKTATIVGETTFGKGTVQELSFFSDGTALKLTVAHWFSPNEQPINKHGVTPDINALDDDKTLDIDEALDKAMSMFN